MKIKLTKLIFWRHLSEKQKVRWLGMIPGGLAWLLFILAFILSFIRPIWVIYFIIIYAFFWLIRVTYFVFYLAIAWHKHRQEIKVDWLAKVQGRKDWDKLYHAVFFPTWKEPYEIIATTFEALKKSQYPLNKLIVVLGGEERAGQEINKKLKRIKRDYKETFYKLIVTLHPQDLPNEIIGKGSNEHYMGHRFQKWVDRQPIPYEDIIVSIFDCDTQVHPQYLARVAYAYLTDPEPTRASYQPLILYNNNVWEAPSLTRVVASSTTFWLMTELTRPEQFMTFSSHSMSFKALVDVGFWDKTIVTEDSRIFLQCFTRYEGNYRLVPIYVPVNMDTVDVGSFKQTLVNQYKQMRRWAWSIEHQPWMITHFFRRPSKIPLQVRLRYVWKMTEGPFSWATGAVMILIFGRLPIAVATAQQHSAVLVQNAPFILEDLMTIAMIGIGASAILMMLLLPAKPPKYHWTKYAVMVLQWILLPVTIIVFGSIPALDAQTRLMINKPLGFWNTEKERRK